MNQTRTGSLIESTANVLIGLGINLTANALIFPLFGWPLSLSQNLQLGILYTAISIARSYCVRRWFNQHLLRASKPWRVE